MFISVFLGRLFPENMPRFCGRLSGTPKGCCSAAGKNRGFRKDVAGLRETFGNPESFPRAGLVLSGVPAVCCWIVLYLRGIGCKVLPSSKPSKIYQIDISLFFCFRTPFEGVVCIVFSSDLQVSS